MAEKASNGYGIGNKATAAFSLVEVVMAIGIVSFSLILLVALLPIGLKSNRDSMQESLAVNLLQSMIADRQASAFFTNSAIYNLPSIANVTNMISGTNFIMENCVTTNAQPTVARYCVTYTIYPATNIYSMATNYSTSQLPQPVLIDFKVSWPAVQASQSSSVETVATFMK